MPTQQALALHWLDHACQNLSDHLPRLTLAEALFAPSGGYRSILGTLKHTAGDKQLAAQLLGISARTIYRKLGAEKGDEAA